VGIVRQLLLGEVQPLVGFKVVVVDRAEKAYLRGGDRCETPAVPIGVLQLDWSDVSSVADAVAVGVDAPQVKLGGDRARSPVVAPVVLAVVVFAVIGFLFLVGENDDRDSGYHYCHHRYRENLFHDIRMIVIK